MAVRRYLQAVKAVVYVRYGGPEDLGLREVPAPAPRSDEVMVRVHAATLNPVDWKVLRGDLKLVSGRRMPRRIGSDFAGSVFSTGTEVNRFKPGDTVLGSISPLSGQQGSLAEYLCIPESRLVRKPPELPFTHAACLPIAGVSAWDCVHRLGHAEPGQRVLVIGATGGVGSFCIQLAKTHGLAVTAVCNSRNVDLARELGADEIVPYDQKDPSELTEKFHLIIDAAAKYSYRQFTHLLTTAGIYVSTMPGPRTLFDAVRTAMLGRRRAHVLMARVNRASVEKLTMLASTGTIQVIIGHTFALDQVKEAFKLSTSGHVRGKIAILIANPC